MTRATNLFSQASPPRTTEASTVPNDRATTFAPVEGGGEHQSGTALMVEAYAVIWTILMVWLLLLWRRQAKLSERLDGLEGAIAKASARPASTRRDPGSTGFKDEGAAHKLGGQPS